MVRSAIVQVDQSLFPLVVTVCPRTVDANEIEDYFVQLDAVAGRGRFALLVDLRLFDAEATTPILRQLFNDRTNAWDKKHPRALLAEATVLGSPVHRLMFTAYQWMRRSRAYESRAFASVAEARAWLDSVLKKAAPVGASAPR